MDDRAPWVVVVLVKGSYKTMYSFSSVAREESLLRASYSSVITKVRSFVAKAHGSPCHGYGSFRILCRVPTTAPTALASRLDCSAGKVLMLKGKTAPSRNTG